MTTAPAEKRVPEPEPKHYSTLEDCKTAFKVIEDSKDPKDLDDLYQIADSLQQFVHTGRGLLLDAQVQEKINELQDLEDKGVGASVAEATAPATNEAPKELIAVAGGFGKIELPKLPENLPPEIRDAMRAWAEQVQGVFQNAVESVAAQVEVRTKAQVAQIESHVEKEVDNLAKLINAARAEAEKTIADTMAIERGQEVPEQDYYSSVQRQQQPSEWQTLDELVADPSPEEPSPPPRWVPPSFLSHSQEPATPLTTSPTPLETPTPPTSRPSWLDEPPFNAGDTPGGMGFDWTRRTNTPANSSGSSTRDEFDLGDFGEEPTFGGDVPEDENDQFYPPVFEAPDKKEPNILNRMAKFARKRLDAKATTGSGWAFPKSWAEKPRRKPKSQSVFGRPPSNMPNRPSINRTELPSSAGRNPIIGRRGGTDSAPTPAATATNLSTARLDRAPLPPVAPLPPSVEGVVPQESLDRVKSLASTSLRQISEEVQAKPDQGLSEYQRQDEMDRENYLDRNDLQMLFFQSSLSPTPTQRVLAGIERILQTADGKAYLKTLYLESLHGGNDASKQQARALVNRVLNF